MFFFSCEEGNNNDSNECILYGTWDFFYFMDNDGDYCDICPETPISDSPCLEKHTYIYQYDCPTMVFNEDGTYISDDGMYGDSVSIGSWSSNCSDSIVLDGNEANIISISNTILIIQGGDGTWAFKK